MVKNPSGSGSWGSSLTTEDPGYVGLTTRVAGDGEGMSSGFRHDRTLRPEVPPMVDR